MSDRRLLHLVGIRGAIRRVPNVSTYDRQRAMSRRLALWPHEIADGSVDGRLLVCKQLRRAIRAERRRGIGAHPTYSVWRHAELLRDLRKVRIARALRNGTRDLRLSEGGLVESVASNATRPPCPAAGNSWGGPESQQPSRGS